MGPSRHLRRAALLAAALLLATAFPASRAQEETEHQEEFSYKPGAENGPEHWGDIKPEWSTCSTGRMQSPIDLACEHVTVMRSLGYLNHSYRPAQASIVNRGHDIKVMFEGDAGSLVINGTAYHLVSVHWHSPSEHTINGCRYDVEMHMVHQSAAKKIAVVGVLYRIGRPRDAFLHRLEPFIELVAGTWNQPEPVGEVDPRVALGTGAVYYRYMGSLTTPPCAEGVIWTVLGRVRTMSECQLEVLRDAVNHEDNARPLQKLNNRDIGLFRPTPLSNVIGFNFQPHASD